MTVSPYKFSTSMIVASKCHLSGYHCKHPVTSVGSRYRCSFVKLNIGSNSA